MTTRHWMYNANRRSNEIIAGVREFLRVAEENKQDSFMCCPYAACMSLKEFCSSRSIHLHLFKLGFMSNYICWTKHRETGVMMEEGEEEQAAPYDVFAQYCDFAMEEGEEEVDAKNTV